MEIKSMSRPVVGLLVIAGNVALGSVAHAAGPAPVTTDALTVTNGGSMSMGKSGAATGDPVINISDTNFYMGVKNANGEVNGIRATSTSTTIKGGTATTSETINDAGVKFSSTTSGSKDGTDARVTGVANGRIKQGSTDAINGGQLFTTNENLTTTNERLTTTKTELTNHINHNDGSLNFNKNLSATYQSGGEGGGTYTDTPHNLTDAVNAETRRAMTEEKTLSTEEKTLSNGEGNLKFNKHLVTTFSDGEGGTYTGTPKTLTQAVNAETSRSMTSEQELTIAQQTETNRATAAEMSLQNEITTDVNILNNRVDNLQDKAMGGIASAIAMAPSVMPSAPGKTAVSVGTGFYAGYSAVGINITHSVVEWADHRGNITFGASQADRAGSSAKLGFGFEF
jgi:autotransporter adhesin